MTVSSQFRQKVGLPPRESDAPETDVATEVEVEETPEAQPGADEDGFGGDAPEPEGGHPEVEETQPGADEDGFGGDAPEPEGGHPEVTETTDPDELTEAELEAATNPEGEEA